MSAEVAGAIARVRAWREDRRRAGQRVGFVPTMGALHRGHGRLIEVARERSDAVVAATREYASDVRAGRYPQHPQTVPAGAAPNRDK